MNISKSLRFISKVTKAVEILHHFCCFNVHPVLNSPEYQQAYMHVIVIMFTMPHPDLDDLFDVRKELSPVSAKWRSIGIALRLKTNILDGINTCKNGDPTACLNLVVTEWLNRNYNVKRFGEPTWRWFVEAVSDPAGGANMAQARDIARRHQAGGMPIVLVALQSYKSKAPLNCSSETK